MTLTTEQLNDFAGVFRKDAARWVESGEPEIALELHALADELDALAANREAQPVGFRYRHTDTVSWLYNDWRCPDSVEAEECQIEWLYTAPPAPAPAPAVPGKPRLPPHVYRDLLDMLQEAAIAYGGTQQLRAQLSSALSIHVQPDHPHTRAAMLAQPVSSSYTLPEGFKLMPLEMTDEIGEAIAMKARCCGEIALCIYEAALAAAKQGDAEKI